MDSLFPGVCHSCIPQSPQHPNLSLIQINATKSCLTDTGFRLSGLTRMCWVHSDPYNLSACCPCFTDGLTKPERQPTDGLTKPKRQKAVF